MRIVYINWSFHMKGLGNFRAYDFCHTRGEQWERGAGIKCAEAVRGLKFSFCQNKQNKRKSLSTSTASSAERVKMLKSQRGFSLLWARVILAKTAQHHQNPEKNTSLPDATSKSRREQSPSLLSRTVPGGDEHRESHREGRASYSSLRLAASGAGAGARGTVSSNSTRKRKEPQRSQFRVIFRNVQQWETTWSYLRLSSMVTAELALSGFQWFCVCHVSHLLMQMLLLHVGASLCPAPEATPVAIQHSDQEFTFVRQKQMQSSHAPVQVCWPRI